MGDFFEKLGNAIQSFAWDHPRAVGGVAAFFVLGSIVSNVLRSIYRDQTTRPAWAIGILAALDPFIGNFWTLLAWAAAKIGIQLKPPSSDLSASVRQAEKP